MDFTLKVNGKEYNIEVKPNGKKAVEIEVEGEKFVFHERSGEKKRDISVAKTSIPKRDFGEKKIKAPIAGSVSKVFVENGQFVNKGDKILLLSAMKMENEIVAEFKGKVKKVLVNQDQMVREGDVLTVIE